MSAWKQPFLLSKNKTELNACIMILETNRSEGEDYLFYSYKTNDASGILINLKGIILASTGISNSIFYDDFRIVKFSETTTNQVYKVCAKSYLKNYLVTVVLPDICPDNIILYICKEFIEFLNLFFEKFEETSKFTDILNKYSEVLLFSSVNYSLKKEKEDTTSTPLSNMPLMNITFTYNESSPCFLVKPPMNDNLRTEIIEILNTLNSDRSVLQETLTLMDPPFFIRGFALFYNGFVIYNTLSNKELSSLSRLSMLHEMYVRSKSSSEILSCEFLFENDDFDNPSRVLNKNEEKNKILVTLLAQREFVLLISLDILGKNNCSFDPFYNKRAEDLVISLLKKGYNVILANELHNNSIKMINEPSSGEEKIFNDNESELNLNKRRNSDSSFISTSKLNPKKKDEILDAIHSRIKGYIDIETKVNIIHFSCYDDSECIVNTTDLHVTGNIFKEIYRCIFKEYAKIQSNINKLKQRAKLLRLRSMQHSDQVKLNYAHTLTKDNNLKSKLHKEKFLSNLKVFKLNEYGFKLNVENNIPIWICCKIYEHSAIEDEANMDEYANYKIIFVSYESHSPVDIDSFCQDLLINELFI
jgi:hypothetical protein